MIFNQHIKLIIILIKYVNNINICDKIVQSAPIKLAEKIMGRWLGPTKLCVVNLESEK